MARLVIQQLAKKFSAPRSGGVRAVAGLDLTVESGELLVLAGPSGCGKTTTLRLIAGLEKADQGSITLAGRDVTKLPPQEREVAMVFQNHALFPHLTVRENLAFSAMLRKRPTTEAAGRVQEAAQVLGLTDCLERLPETLSGGQRQRVALGRAMVQQPKVFLLDEPLAHLDAPLRAQLRREIANWQRRTGATMIYVTHEQTEALALAGRLAIMRAGEVQQVAPPREVYERPANRFVAGFIGSPAMNFINGMIISQDGQRFFREAGEGGFAVPVSTELKCGTATDAYRPAVLGIRPNAVNLGMGGAPAAVGIAAVVDFVELAGPETFLYLRTRHHAIVARASAETVLAAGSAVNVTLDLRQVRFFDPITELAMA